MAVTMGASILCNPKWNSGTTLIFAMGRYVFATPFFYVFLNYFVSKHGAFKLNDFVVTFVLCNLIWLLCGSYTQLSHFLIFNALTVLVYSYMVWANKDIKIVSAALIIMNITIQIILYRNYLNGLFPD